jgi:hypothetical protein
VSTAATAHRTLVRLRKGTETGVGLPAIVSGDPTTARLRPSRSQTTATKSAIPARIGIDAQFPNELHGRTTNTTNTTLNPPQVSCFETELSQKSAWSACPGFTTDAHSPLHSNELLPSPADTTNTTPNRPQVSCFETGLSQKWARSRCTGFETNRHSPLHSEIPNELLPLPRGTTNTTPNQPEMSCFEIEVSQSRTWRASDTPSTAPKKHHVGSRLRSKIPNELRLRANEPPLTLPDPQHRKILPERIAPLGQLSLLRNLFSPNILLRATSQLLRATRESPPLRSSLLGPPRSDH